MTHAAASSDEQTPTDRRANVYSLVGWSVLVLLVLGLAWVVVTGLIARSKLDAARNDIGSLRTAIAAGDITKAEKLAASVTDATSSAHALTTGPAWWISANLPVVGTPLRTTRVIADQLDRLGSQAIPAVVQVTKSLPSGRNSSLSSLDLTPVERAAAPVHRAAEVATSALTRLRATGRSWLPQVATARDSLVTELTRLDGELAGADRAVRIVPTMLGAHGTKRYFIAFLNEAESRGGGGISGAYAIATANRGRVTFEHFGSDADFAKYRSTAQLGEDFDARYANNDPYHVIQNANLSPDFGYAARIWAGFWQAKTKERVDGAIALDPTALSYLLQVTGPASVSATEQVTGDNVVALTQQQQYARFPTITATANSERKKFLISIAKAVSRQLTSRSSDPVALVRAASHAARERRLLVYSTDTEVERELRESGWGGTLGAAAGEPYSGFSVNNAAGSKLDYYLGRRMTYSRSACTSGATATATFAMTNDAPRSGLPAYVTIRADDAPRSARPGDNRVLLTYYADKGARITAFTIDGKPVQFVPQPEGDTVAVTTTVELPAGRTVTARVTVSEPGSGPVTVLRQPGVRDLEVDTTGDRCS